MRELKPDHETLVVAGCLDMRLDDDLAQFGNVGLRVIRHVKLLGIGAPVRPHRAGFSAPDQLCAALPETLPSALGVIARTSVMLAVPAFHGMHAQTMTDRHAFEVEG